jgi:hypothetical protein
MAENGIASVPITDFSDLERTAREVSFLTRSPEVAQILSQRKRARDEAKANKKKAGPTLRVIENADWGRNTPPPAS